MSDYPKEMVELFFAIRSSQELNFLALEIFNYQSKNNLVYKEYIKLLNKDAASINTLHEIPFLPIEFFKNTQVITGEIPTEIIFESSGTTGLVPSRHYVSDTQVYIKSITKCFKLFLGEPDQYCILALLPSYLERKNSSLVFMADTLIKATNHPSSGFFLHNHQELSERLKRNESEGVKTILLGVSFALQEFAAKFPIQLKNTIIMETGGMKGRRKEVARTELHSELKKMFGVDKIYSEYGMTELLSQAYSTGEGIFKAPPWMKIIIRNPYDPFDYLPAGSAGGINVIDLANINSCSFIQTDDLGKLNDDISFEVLGRMDSAELRGCNLLLE